ncbi:MAG: hypothetical protein RL328_2343 [Acidobacteriota bacterium]|jgi:glucose uptake protein
MLLPQSATAVLVALVIGLLGWSAWVSFFKAGKKIRFEFFAYDFAWGVVLATVVAAFTLGSWDSKELTFQDNFLLTGMRKMAWAAGSGMVFNLANLLLLAATAVAGSAVAFSIAFGLAWAVGGVVTYFTQPDVNPLLAFGGAGVTFLAAVLAMVAYAWLLAEKAHSEDVALRADPRAKGAPQSESALKGIFLAVVSGLAFGGFFPMMAEATTGDNGVSAYGYALLVAGAVFGSSIVLVPFFLNFPVKGKALSVAQYVKIPLGHHLLGLAGGVVWSVGLLGGLLHLGVAASAEVSPVVIYLLNHGTPVLTTLLGLLVWGEFRGAPTRATAMAGAVLALLIAGTAMLAVAPVNGR